MNTTKVLATFAVLAFVTTPVQADWFDGDPYKMHWPQLPDPNGWDVALDEIVDPANGIYRGPLGDDWQCSETGFVDDIHIWVSFREDFVPDEAAGEFVAGFVEIWSDVPAGSDSAVPYSHPGTPLWGMGFDTLMSNVTMREYGTGDQGWLEPYSGLAIHPDHQQYFQINIDPVRASIKPFIQREGDIYWLVSHMMILDAAGNRVEGKEIGWKTTLDSFQDGAVFGNPYYMPPGPMWLPVHLYNERLDLAFVITGSPIPEPSSLALLGLGLAGLAMVRRRW